MIQNKCGSSWTYLYATIGEGGQQVLNVHRAPNRWVSGFYAVNTSGGGWRPSCERFRGRCSRYKSDPSPHRVYPFKEGWRQQPKIPKIKGLSVQPQTSLADPLRTPKEKTRPLPSRSISLNTYICSFIFEPREQSSLRHNDMYMYL